VRGDVAQPHRLEAALLRQLDGAGQDPARALLHAAIGTRFTRGVQIGSGAAPPREGSSSPRGSRSGNPGLPRGGSAGAPQRAPRLRERQDARKNVRGFAQAWNAASPTCASPKTPITAGAARALRRFATRVARALHPDWTSRKPSGGAEETDAMLHLGRSRCAIPTFAVLLAASAGAGADEDQPPERTVIVTSEERGVVESKQVNEVESPRSDERDWFSRHFRKSKGHGFEYSRSFTMGRDKRRIVFSVQGPLVKKKVPGIGIEIRF
jgi:hypothetical protein